MRWTLCVSGLAASVFVRPELDFLHLPFLGSLFGLALIDFYGAKQPLFARVHLQAKRPSALEDVRLWSSAQDTPLPFDEIVKGPALLLFLRGSWCPLCVSHDKDVPAFREEFERFGVQIFLVTTQSPEAARRFEESIGQGVRVLSDADLEIGLRLQALSPVFNPFTLASAENPTLVYFPLDLLLDGRGEVLNVHQTNDLTIRDDAKAPLKVCQDNLIERELRELVDEKARHLQKALNDKAALVRMVFHDLNNSQAILLRTSQQALSRSHLAPEENLRSWKRVERAVRNQNQILGSVRAFEALSSGKAKLDLEDLEPGDVVDHVAFAFSHAAQSAGIHLEMKNTLSEGARLRENRGAFLHQVLENLVSNAPKFTREGGFVSITLEEESQSGLFLCTVSDSGRGMTEEQLGRIFDAHSPSGTRGELGEKGTGFGMPIVKKLAEAMGGSIQISSALGRGTVVSARLPLSHPESARAAA